MPRDSFAVTAGSTEDGSGGFFPESGGETLEGIRYVKCVGVEN